jgi:hypothetical protein
VEVDAEDATRALKQHAQHGELADRPGAEGGDGVAVTHASQLCAEPARREDFGDRDRLLVGDLVRQLHPRRRSNQLTGLRSVRFAISMRLAMRITQWLERPASDFVYAARW